ncbi:CTP-dependent Riboflavin kinase [Methanonatronarchaeum thermophilum]|uniref:Riboflavin kinase n=1 Tax=Methanonatronarchaeum thermophilum TaxID=1927129 RepID=A0A1Y3G9R3_9EURY|nr:DUF120 domain-containing protein [Methanonatronarchaeum thermophilum]OUJ18182.1 CTP-dependent Riboflavin kinase [Methanonatronarchaeum thermophilum]
MIDSDNLQLLKTIALQEKQKTTNTELAQKLDYSPQTISRRLNNLEKNKYINREVDTNGQIIKISKKGYNTLKKEYKDYKNIFYLEMTKTLQGHVIDGIGEGKYYISQPEYQQQFKQKLGFKAYPGTLNIKLNKKSIKKYQLIKQKNGIMIKGFQKGERTFGDSKCYKSRINGIKSAIIQPNRSHYKDDIIEIISPERLRNKLEKNKVKIEVQI